MGSLAAHLHPGASSMKLPPPMMFALRHYCIALTIAAAGVCVAAPATAAPTGKAGVKAPARGAKRGKRKGFRAIKRRSKLTMELARKGEEELQRSVRVFQQRYLIKKFRAELVVGGATELGDPLVHHWASDVGLTFHLSQRWAIGVSGMKAWGSRQEAFDAVQDDFGLFPERSLIQAGGFGEVQFSPVFGKFASFGLAVVQMDAYLIAGGGAVRTNVGEELKPTGLVGFGLRIHALRALTLSLEIRDLIYQEGFLLDRSEVLQHVFGGIKLGLWIPPTFTYRFQR